MIVKRSIYTVVAIVAVCLIVYIGGNYLESLPYSGNSTRSDLPAKRSNMPIIEYGGRQYRYNENIVSILFMGIDKAADAEGVTGNYRNGGQADFLMLLVIDHDKKTTTELHIDRDSMAEISILGVLGNDAGTREAQICLSHAFGDGAEQSNKFTVQAVERLLCGINIDFYVTLDLTAIPRLNDAVGGVPMTISEDLTAHDPLMAPGAHIVLNGTQTELYVRRRLDVGDGTNAARMIRQQQYLEAFLALINQRIGENVNYIGSFFDITEGIITTNINRGRMINEANKAMRYEKTPNAPLHGEHIIVDNFVQFIVDEQSLENLVLGTFYDPVS